MKLSLPLVFILCSVSAVSNSSGLVSRISEKYPEGLLTESYGVLTEEDLALNACRYKPKPFTLNSSTPYEYWQCFRTNEISLSCEPSGTFDRSVGETGRVVVIAGSANARREFIESRPWSMKECKSFLKDLHLIMTGTAHTCISASHIGNHQDETGRDVLIGIFHRLKTRKGCEGEACIFTQSFRHNYCPASKG